MNHRIFGYKFTSAIAGAVFALGLAASGPEAVAAPEGTVKKLVLNLTSQGPGIRVISGDGQKWTHIEDTTLQFATQVQIEMGAIGKIRIWGIYWGACDGDGCFEGFGTPLLHSHFVPNGADEFNQNFTLQFPASKIPFTTPSGIAPTPYGDEAIARCNEKLTQGKGIHETHVFSHSVPMTIGVDTYVGLFSDPPQAALPRQPTPLADVDADTTSWVEVPVTCVGVSVTPSAGTPGKVVAELPPFEVLSATLHGHPPVYEGACPVDLKLFMSATSNIKGPFEARVEAKSGWRSEKYTSQTSDPNQDGTWTKHFQETLTIPIVLPDNPSSGGGAGTFAGGIDQVTTVPPDPGIVFPPDPGGTPSATGQFQTGYDPGNLHEDSLRLKVSGGGKTVVTDWWKYSVTCDPQVAPFAGSAPQTFEQPIFVQQAFLALFPEAPTDGSKCGVNVSGLIQTNVKNATVKFRLKNHQGHATNWQTIQTSHPNNTGLFVEYLDFSSGGQGVWVSQGGGWAMPDTVGQAGHKAGTLQIVTEQPTLFEGNVASYDFTCHDPAPGGLKTAPTVNLNPDLPDSSNDLVRRQHTGPDIVWIQQRLFDLGYREVGKADGIIGGHTRRALLAFKADNGLPPTPEIDGEVMSALLAAAPRRVPPTGRPTTDEKAIVGPGTARPRKTVGTPAPSITCEGGAIRNGQCVCRRGFRPIKSGANGYRCAFVAVDPPPVLPPAKRVGPTITCEGGVVRARKCVCPRGLSLRNGACRPVTVTRQGPQRVSPQPQRVAPSPQRVAPQPQRVSPQPHRVSPQPQRVQPLIRRTP